MRKLHSEELNKLYSSPNNISVAKEDEMGEISTSQTDEKSLQNFDPLGDAGADRTTSLKIVCEGLNWI